MKINLGCGVEYRAGWQNWDISNEVKTDALVDIRIDDFPAPPESADEIYCSGVLEQILLNEHLIHALNECHRILKVGGKLTIIVPNGRYPISFRDPMDCRRFMEDTWNYLDKDHVHYKKYGKTYGFKPWKKISVTTNQSGIMTINLEKCE
jgi:predicted SAM-dependent methyltransferase